MAEGKISFNDIFAEDIFERAKKSAEALLEVLKSLDDRLQRLAQINAKTLQELEKEPKTAQNYAKITRAANDLANNLKQVSYVQRQLQVTQKKLDEINTEYFKDLQKARHQLKEATKDYRAMAKSEEAAALSAQLLEKAQKGLYESYHEMSETLEKLRIRYKDLVAAGKENSEEAQNLKAAIVQLDAKVKQIDYSVGQYQRNVGNYLGDMRTFWSSLKTEAMNAQGPLGQIISMLFGMQTAFKAAGGGLAGLAASVKLLSRAIMASGIMFLLSMASGALSKIQDWFSGVFGGGEGLRKAWQALKVTEERARLERELVFAEIDLSRSENLESINKYYEARIKLKEYELQLVRKEIAEKNKNYQIESGKIAANKKELAELLEKINSLREQEVSIENELIKIQAEREDKLLEFERKRREAIEGLISDIRSYQNFEKAQITEMVERYNELGDELIAKITEVHKKWQLTLKEYNAIEEELNKAKAASYAKFLKEITSVAEENTNKLIEIYKGLTGELYEVPISFAEEEKLSKVKKDLQGIITELNAMYEEGKKNKDIWAEYERIIAEIQSKAKIEALTPLGTKSFIQIDWKKIIEEKNFDALNEYLNKISEAKQEFESVFDFQKNIESWLKKDEELFILEGEKIYKSYEEFQKARQEYLLKKRIEYIEIFYKKIKEKIEYFEKEFGYVPLELTELLDKIKAQRMELELQYLDLMRSLAQATEEELKNKIKQQIKEIGDELAKFMDLFDAIIEKIEARRSARLERSISATRNRFQILVAQYQRGADAASGSIAELEKREAALLREQEKLKRQAQQREAALSAFRSYSAQLQQGVPPGQALVNVIRDLSFITQLVRALPTFYQGTEFVKPALNPIGAIQDTILARVHQGERIVPADINRKLGNVKNEDLPKLIEAREKISFDYDSLLNVISLISKRNNITNKINKKI